MTSPRLSIASNKLSLTSQIPLYHSPHRHPNLPHRLNAPPAISLTQLPLLLNRHIIPAIKLPQINSYASTSLPSPLDTTYNSLSRPRAHIPGSCPHSHTPASREVERCECRGREGAGRLDGHCLQGGSQDCTREHTGGAGGRRHWGLERGAK